MTIDPKKERQGPDLPCKKTSKGKIVAQVRYASRLPRIAAKQDYLSQILPRIVALEREKCDQHHGIDIEEYRSFYGNAALCGDSRHRLSGRAKLDRSMRHLRTAP